MMFVEETHLYPTVRSTLSLDVFDHLVAKSIKRKVVDYFFSTKPEILVKVAWRKLVIVEDFRALMVNACDYLHIIVI